MVFGLNATDIMVATVSNATDFYVWGWDFEEHFFSRILGDGVSSRDLLESVGEFKYNTL